MSLTSSPRTPANTAAWVCKHLLHSCGQSITLRDQEPAAGANTVPKPPNETSALRPAPAAFRKLYKAGGWTQPLLNSSPPFLRAFPADGCPETWWLRKPPARARLRRKKRLSGRQSSSSQVTFVNATRWALQQEVTECRALLLGAFPSVTVFALPHGAVFVHGALTWARDGPIRPRGKGVCSPPPPYEPLSLIHFSYVSPCKCTKTNIHCNIYEHSLIVTMVSKKTVKMDTRVDAPHIRRL